MKELKKEHLKIKRGLPQFNNEKAIILVLGKEEGFIFRAKNRNINVVGKFEEKALKYSDRKKDFDIKAGSKTLRVGSPSYSIKSDQRHKFVKKSVINLIAITKREKPDLIYLLLPAYLSKMVRDRLPAEIRRKLVFTVMGNYIRKHPFVILEKIIN
ncbi:MAG: hypothetical protein COV70_01790 [Parcubacteria group bacterium CG11_big_fil_rev_8_21_14_0_20_39_22]|nr:MAG: hypothetical protein COV70_01790 [Parcubacteria group bacterium CG11_big_fil_rev_8_21_14_0_20_39_22]